MTLKKLNNACIPIVYTYIFATYKQVYITPITVWICIIYPNSETRVVLILKLYTNNMHLKFEIVKYDL